MSHDALATRINNVLRAVFLAKQAVTINMVRLGLLRSEGWAIGQSFKVDEEGNMIQDFVPVRSAGTREIPGQVRPDLGVRVIIRVRPSCE
jgi:hypothetical protein